MRLEDLTIPHGFVPIDEIGPGYFINSSGVVISTKRVKPYKVLKPSIDKDGYFRISYRQDKKPRNTGLHRLIASVFVDGFFNGAVVNHKNGNKQDNRPENLEWVTPADNERHSRKYLGKRLFGEKSSRRKLTEKDVHEIRKRIYRGQKVKSISKEFNLSDSQVRRVWHGKSWGHIETDLSE